MTRTLAEKIREGDRRALAKGITMVESSLPEDTDEAARLVSELAPFSGGALRLGITGVPGVGKSTFIEALGSFLTEGGKKVAVLTIDPSSLKTGGSILGDKTRMEKLARDDNAFIRPSPSRGDLGGVARHSRESVLLCEAAGYDVVIVETVGVGQSELDVADMTDVFLLLLLPGGGDELQGIKRGILEVADLVVLNKADGDMLPLARQSASLYQGALHFLRSAGTPKVLLTSALTGQGIKETWEEIEVFIAAEKASGEFTARRAEQNVSWMWKEVRSLMLDKIAARGGGFRLLEEEVRLGKKAPGEAARILVKEIP